MKELVGGLPPGGGLQGRLEESVGGRVGNGDARIGVDEMVQTVKLRIIVGSMCLMGNESLEQVVGLAEQVGIGAELFYIVAKVVEGVLAGVVLREAVVGLQ